MSISVFEGTPSIAVVDPRGLHVRELQYHRHPDSPDATTRIIRHQYDTRGFLTQSIDPRLYALQQSEPTVNANFTYLTAPGGTVLQTKSVDAGTSLTLSDVAGRPTLSVSATGVVRSWQYEVTSSAGRVLSITEQSGGETARITERFVYAGTTPAEQALNLVGQCVRHYDTAGVNETGSIALTGGALSVSRQLLQDTVAVDWQGASETAWQELLSTERYTTHSVADATGAALMTTDAMGNVQRQVYDVVGQLKKSWLTLAGGTEQSIVQALIYSAAGQKLREEHGNGVVTTYTYEPQSQRLTGIKTERPVGHAVGAMVLQDLRYAYDPVGNVLKVSNETEGPRFWRNQRVVPENTYTYDSLYQLVSATGREMANAGQQGSGQSPSAAILPTDSNTFTNYTRTYSYDTGGNLTQVRHSAPLTNNSYTIAMTVSNRSNRAVLSSLTAEPVRVDALFDAGGNQHQLRPGQTVTWTTQGELLKVTPIMRDGQASDAEYYRYATGSQRVVKIRTRLTGGSMQSQRVVYLPGLEQRITRNGSVETENLQVICMGESGRAQVRVLHWEVGQPTGTVANNQWRYSYDNLIGSCGLELDGSGETISQEEYYPYGGTAVWAARSQTEASYKTVRYSGKERDATGLYYYGYRYYQPWAGRWLSADPAGTVDGLNLYRMCRNNPISLKDDDGRQPVLPPPPPPLPGPPPPPPPPPGKGMPPLPVSGETTPRRNWSTATSLAIHEQQGSKYKYISTFSRALHKLNIKHYSSIKDEGTFVDEWKKIASGMLGETYVNTINVDFMAEIQGIFTKIDEEWGKYKKSTVKETFRGDGTVIEESYPWFADFLRENPGGNVGVNKDIDQVVESTTIMSTAESSLGNGYLTGAKVFWHFELDEGHRGISEPIFKGEGEVTFPLYNRMKIMSLQYIPEGESYMGNAQQYGKDHRYIIKAKMLPGQSNS